MSKGFVRLLLAVLGIVWLQWGCVHDQVVDDNVVVKVPPELAACVKLGRAEVRLPQAAVATCRKAHRLVPPRADLLLALAHIHQGRQEWKEAADALAKASARGVSSPQLLFRRFKLLVKGGLYQQAIKVVGWKKMSPRWRLYILYKMGKHKKAEQYAHILLARRPKRPEVYRQLLVMYEEQGLLRKALLVGTIGLQLISPRDPDLHNNVGVLLLKLKQPQRAVYHFRKALAINRHHPDALYNLGCYYQAKGYWRLAEPQWVKFLQADATPEARRREVLRMYGRLLLKQRKLREARVVFQKLLEKQPKDPEALFQVGVSYYLLRDAKAKRRCLPWFKRFLAQPQSKKLPQYKQSALYIKQAKARLAILAQ